MAISPLMRSRISSYSAASFSCSKPVRRCKRNSRMAWACSGDRWYLPSRMPYSSDSPSGRVASSLPARSNICTTRPGSHALPNKLFFASAEFGDAFIKAITSSIFARDTVKPSSKCTRALALDNSKTVRRVTTSLRCLTKASRICLRFKMRG